jgi:crossover junction endodeoxyribonuclease RusA
VREIHFTIQGEPVAKDRPRCSVKRKGAQVWAEAHDTQKNEKAAADIGWEFKAQNVGHEPFTGPVRVTMTFYEGKRPPQQRQDLDNLIKQVLDALNHVAWVDDTQVMGITAEVYRDCNSPRTDVNIGEL